MITEKQIEHMIRRFLTWKLPETFNPDGGISFNPIGNQGTPHEFKREPYGTSLFDFTQTKQMILHMIEDVPEVSQDRWLSMESAPKDGSEFVAGRRWPSGNVSIGIYRWVGPPNYWLEKQGSTCIQPKFQDPYKWIALPRAWEANNASD